MLRRSKYILALLTVLLLAVPEADAQSKFTEKIKSLFSKEKKVSPEINVIQYVHFTPA